MTPRELNSLILDHPNLYTLALNGYVGESRLEGYDEDIIRLRVPENCYHTFPQVVQLADFPAIRIIVARNLNSPSNKPRIQLLKRPIS